MSNERSPYDLAFRYKHENYGLNDLMSLTSYDLMQMTKQLLFDYLARSLGHAPVISFPYDEWADCCLWGRVPLRPYHFPSYKGRFCDPEDEAAWLRTCSAKRAFYWACAHPAEAHIVIDCVNESEWAYQWALMIGDREIMRDRVTESKWAYEWALSIGDRAIMHNRVIEPKWAYYWVRDIGDDEIMRGRITEMRWALEWLRTYAGTREECQIVRAWFIEDYLRRICGQPPLLKYASDKDADYYLRSGYKLRPYHFPSYDGRFCHYIDEREWLQRRLTENIYFR